MRKRKENDVASKARVKGGPSVATIRHWYELEYGACTLDGKGVDHEEAVSNTAYSFNITPAQVEAALAYESEEADKQ